MEKGLGFSNFLAQLDGVGISVLLLLLALSVASWYLILTKRHFQFSGGKARRRLSQAFLEREFSTGGELYAEGRVRR